MLNILLNIFVDVDTVSTVPLTCLLEMVLAACKYSSLGPVKLRTIQRMARLLVNQVEHYKPLLWWVMILQMQKLRYVALFRVVMLKIKTLDITC